MTTRDPGSRSRALHVAAGNLYGGVERILVEIAGVPSAAWTHEFAVCFEGRLLAELRESGAVCHVLKDVRFSRPPTVWRARRRLRQAAAGRGFDATICHSPWAFALAAPAASGRRVLWAHDALLGTHWTERRAGRAAPDLAICNSRYTASAVGAWLTDTAIDVVYAPVAARPASAGVRAEVRGELGANGDAVVMLMASRFERWKGHAALLDAASTLRGPWTIWIAGGAQRPAERTLARELAAMAERLGIAERVRFLGERHDVPRLMRGADVLCQPNTAPEPFGIAFVEALHSGIPVVTTAGGGAQEIVTPACGVLVPPDDPIALHSTLQTIVDDRRLRTALGSAGPARARLLCDPAAQVAALERVLAPRAMETLA